MDQKIYAARHINNILVLDRIACDDDGAAFIGKAIPNGGLYRSMCNRERLDGKTIVLNQRDGLTLCWFGEGVCSTTGRFKRCDRVAMVRLTVDKVLRIGFVKTINHPFDTRGSVDRKWRVK